MHLPDVNLKLTAAVTAANAEIILIVTAAYATRSGPALWTEKFTKLSVGISHCHETEIHILKSIVLFHSRIRDNKESIEATA